MKRALIIGLLLTLNAEFAACETTYFPPLKPLNEQNSDIQDYTSNADNGVNSFTNLSPNQANVPDLSQIEMTLFGRSYITQSMSLRLTRIEKSLFNTTYSGLNNIQRIDNIISNFNQINRSPNVSSNSLSKIEASVLNRCYAQNTPEERITRLERKIFGAEQTGDINSRLETLKQAARNYSNTAYTSAYAPENVNVGGGSTLRNIAGTLGNAFWGGTMTGFTPQINPYYRRNYAYNPYYGVNRGMYGIQNGYGPGSGIYRTFDETQNFGAGTGVTILD